MKNSNCPGSRERLFRSIRSRFGHSRSTRSSSAPAARERSVLPLLLFAVLFGMGGAAMAAPKVAVMPSYTQLSIYANAEVGQPITVWGRTFDGAAPYTYTLDFGDGSPLQSGNVTDPDEISAVHTYSTAGLKTFTLTVTDNNNETASRSGVIRATIDPTHEQKVNMAISKAKLYLYRTRIETNVGGNNLVQWYGRNGGRNEYSMGASAAVILAFEQVGHLPGNDRELDIYSDMVEKGLEWLTYTGQETTISNQTYGNPDSNNNGKGVLFYTSSSHQTYANAFVGLAFVAAEKEIAGAQARTVQTGPLAGRTYYSLVEDLVDQFAYCQSDSNPTWGGWQYAMNTPSGTSGFDGSSTQWIAFFLESARDLWGINPPAWVVDRMCIGYFTQRQNTSSGGIGYGSSSSWVNTAKTGGALGAYKLGGYTLETDTANTNVARAVDFIGDYYTSPYQWGQSNGQGGVFGAWYGMYSVKRGMVLQEIDRIDTVIGERDWQTDIDLWLLGDAVQLPASINPGERTIGHMFGQQTDGSWSNSAETPGSNFNSRQDMNTAMGILMLTRSLPRPRPVSIITPVGQQSNKPLARAFQMTGEESYHLDPNASVIEYQWDFDDSDGVDWDNPDATGVNVTNPGYDTVGTYVVTLRVKDNGDPAFYDTYTIEVEVVDTDVAPVAVPIPNGVYSGRVNQPITLDGSASYDADGDEIFLYSWDTDGDGNYGDAFGVNPQVTYTSEYVGQVGLQVSAGVTDGGKTSVNTAYADIIVSGTDLSVQRFFASNIDPNVKADLQVTIKSDDQSTNDYTDVQLKFYNGDPLNGGIQVGIPYTFDILKGGTAIVTLTDFMVNGADDLTVWIDSNQGVPEWDEDNNFATANVSNRVLINETDAITENGGERQFIELFDGGSGTTALDDFSVVLYDGADGESYRSIDLTGKATDADGYFVIGTAAVSEADLVLPNGFLQSGEDAVAIHQLPSTDFPNGTAATTDSLVDAVVHGSGQGDGAALATALGFVGAPLDEAAAGNATGHSLQRFPNGGGSPRAAASFSAFSPTPGAANTLPPAPLHLDLTDASDSGSSNSDDLTNDNTPTITGTARPGSLVTLVDANDVNLGTGVANTAGDWSVTSNALADGTHVLSASADGGDASATLTIQIDTTAPNAPSIPDLTSASDSGASDSDNTTKSANPTFTGTADADTSVTLARSGSSADGNIGSGSSDGTWGITSLNAVEGNYSVIATATDPAGNVSPPSGGLIVTFDFTAPAAPTALDLAQASDSGRSDSDDLTNVRTPIINGTAENLASIALSNGATPVATTTSNGTWSVATSSLPEGNVSLTATATDVAGNTSSASTALLIEIDITAPVAPGTPDLLAASDSGISDTDNITADNTPTFSGTAENGADVNLFSGGNAVSTGLSNGNWSITSTALADGARSITANATDAAGNVSPTSSALTIMIDTVAPAAPSIPDLLTDSGVSPNDDLTNDNTPGFSGSAENGSTVTLFSASEAIANGSSTGSWNLTSSTLSDAVHSISATATDVAGNTSAKSAVLPVTIDTTSPSLAFGKASGQNDPATTGPVSFTATFSEVVDGFESSDITVGGSAANAASVGGGPAVFTVSVSTSKAEGTVTATVGAAAATDLAGNPSAAPTLGDTSVSLDVHRSDNPTEMSFTGDSSTATGWLEPGDSDVFTFTITAPKILTAQTTGPVNTRGVLQGSGAVQINDAEVDRDAGAGENFRISEVLAPGTYTLIISSEGSAQTGEYDLSLLLEDIPVLINEVDSDTTTDLEFVELWDGGSGSTALDGYVLVFYRGDTEQVYLAVDLDGRLTDENGYFLVGNADVASVDMVVPPNSIRNGRDAVALYRGSDTDFQVDSNLPVTSNDLLDAVVSVPEGEATGTILASLLLPGEPHLDESANGFRGGQSLQRMPDGEGGSRVSSHFLAAAPTPGAPNAFPPAPGVPDLDTMSDSGRSESDNLSNVTRPSFFGTATPGTVVVLSSSLNGDLGTAFTATDGSWILAETNQDLSQGQHQITSRSGADDATSGSLSIEIDVTAPAAPTAIDLLSSSDSGISDSDNVTSDNTPTVSGDAETGSLVTLFSGADSVGSILANSPWTITASSLSDSIHNLSATATDAAGNTSPPSGILEVTVDTEPPTVTVNQSGTQPDPAASGTLAFEAAFNEPVFNLMASSVTTSGIAGAVSVSGGPETYLIEIETTSAEGYVTASIPAGSATDRAGNTNNSSTSTDNHIDVDRDDAPGGMITPIPSLEGIGSIDGYFHDSDTDTFVFTLDRPRVTILYTTGDTDTKGVLRDDSGLVRNTPEEDDDAGNGENFRISVPLPAGTYQVEISNAGTGVYELHIEAVNLPFLQPDLTVNGKGRTIYGSYGSQTRSKKSRKLRPVTIRTLLFNDGEVIDVFRIKGSRRNRYFKVQHKLTGTGNVTAALVTGRQLTDWTAPTNLSASVSSRVKPKKSRLRKQKNSRSAQTTIYRSKKIHLIFRATSETLNSSSDNVRATVKTKRQVKRRPTSTIKPNNLGF